jgi:hypothetical protein
MLYDRERRIFNIGYNLNADQLDPHHYDLLMSEARLASYFAIAKRDVPAEHWFHLGRPISGVAGELTALSWNGSMFEFLMPALVLGSQEGRLTGRSEHAVVAVQRRYADRSGLPWGVSESSFALRDSAQTYQYQAFGVPGLGLRRGLGEDYVVAPYASGLALAVAPLAAVRNLRRLVGNGAGRHLRDVRGGRFHARTAARGRGLHADTELHGAPPGHDADGDRQPADRQRAAASLHGRPADEVDRAPAAGTRSMGCPARAPAGRDDRGARACPRRAPAAARPVGAARRAPARQPRAGQRAALHHRHHVGFHRDALAGPGADPKPHPRPGRGQRRGHLPPGRRERRDLASGARRWARTCSTPTWPSSSTARTASAPRSRSSWPPATMWRSAA